MKEGKIVLPQQFGIGLSVNKDDVLKLSFDYRTTFWSDYKAFGEQDATIIDSKYTTIGAEFTPKYNDKNFLTHFGYFVSAKYHSTNLKIETEQIKDYGLTLGISIPVKGSKLNISFEVGKKGSLNNDLIQKNYQRINVNFSFADKWFYKRKFK